MRVQLKLLQLQNNQTLTAKRDEKIHLVFTYLQLKFLFIIILNPII